MPVVAATVPSLKPDELVVHWSKDAPLTDVEGFLAYLMDSDGLGDSLLGSRGPGLTAAVGDTFCQIVPDADLWSMVLAEEIAIRLARCQSGLVRDGAGRLLAQADAEESSSWAALEEVGIMSLFRPRPKESPDCHSHPLIPLDDCKISGVSFNEEQECVLDLYFDYWARPCAFLVEEDEETILLYRPMYRFRQALFGPSERFKVSVKAAPQSHIYGALGVRGYKVTHHRVSRQNTWTIKGQGDAFLLRTRTQEAWLTRSLPLWYGGDRLLLAVPTNADLGPDELLQRKEQHWDITDSIWGQEWYVPANTDGTLNPYGRIYRADPIAALLDLPGLRPKEA